MTPHLRSGRAALRLQALESRFAPALVVNSSKLTFQDMTGNSVTVAFSKPVLNFVNPSTLFTFSSGPGAVNGSTATPENLLEVNLTSIPVAATGLGITVTATRGKFTGGDSIARVGEIDATGINLGAVNVAGDLGRILAGNASATVPGLKALTVHSIGQYGTATGAPDTHSVIRGKLGTLTVKGDVRGFVDVQGGEAGSIGTMTIGGSLIGGSVVNGGQVATTGGLGKGTIAGNIEGGTADSTGEISIGIPDGTPNGTIGALTIGGDIIGGSASGSAELVGAGAVVASHIKALTINGSIIAGIDNTSGTDWADGAILAYYEIGSVTIKGSMVGNPTNPAAISAFGQIVEAGGKDVAIASVTVKGRVEFGLIEAGVVPQTAFAFQPADADAQIGSVTVGGDWIESSIAAGSVAGAQGFGTPEDAAMSGNVRNDPTISSSIGNITIGGLVSGSLTASEYYGFVAQKVGKVKVGSATVFQHGFNPTALAIGLFNDFFVHEVT